MLHTQAKQVSDAFHYEALDVAFNKDDTSDAQWHALASFADAALTGRSPSFSHRHVPWTPHLSDKVTHKASSLSEPVDLRRLRWLHRLLMLTAMV